MKRSFRRLLTVLAVAGCLPIPAAAQFGRGNLGTTLYTTVKTKQLSGEVAEVTRRGMKWTYNGQTEPIPMDRQTQFVVRAQGDPGFVQVGAVVRASGVLKPDLSVRDATFEVHPNPKDTVRIDPLGTVRVSSDNPRLSVYGKIVSLDPLVIEAMQTLTPVTVTPNTQGRTGGVDGPPVTRARLQLNLDVKQPESVAVILGNTPQFVAPGDQVRVTVREDRPKVASRVEVRKSEIMKSPAKASADASAKAAEMKGAKKGKKPAGEEDGGDDSE